MGDLFEFKDAMKRKRIEKELKRHLISKVFFGSTILEWLMLATGIAIIITILLKGSPFTLFDLCSIFLSGLIINRWSCGRIINRLYNHIEDTLFFCEYLNEDRKSLINKMENEQ